MNCATFKLQLFSFLFDSDKIGGVSAINVCIIAFNSLSYSMI